MVLWTIDEVKGMLKVGWVAIPSEGFGWLWFADWGWMGLLERG